jgi:3-hydroxy-3-methylglutaryl CoA synthase
MCSYGSGASSDAFIWSVTERIKEVKDLAVRTHRLLDENVIYVDYGTYAKYRHKIRKND